MSTDSISIVPFEGKRVRFESHRSFDEVRESLRQLVPRTIPLESYPAAMEQAGGTNLPAFERVIRAQLGDLGFTLFAEFDHGQWLALYGIQRKVLRLILGNPLIAITFMRHDVEGGLFAPVELLLVDNGEGSAIIYDLPSSLIATKGNPAELEAAQALDGKLRALVSRATGVA